MAFQPGRMSWENVLLRNLQMFLFFWFFSCRRPQQLLPFPKNTIALLLAKMERNCKTWS